MRGELEPGASALLAAVRNSGLPPTHQLQVDQARALMRDRRVVTQAPATGAVQASDRAVDIEGRQFGVRIYRPLTANVAMALPGVVYYHGGGWTIGDLDVYDAALRDLCALTGALVLSVDYRLAPEHPFPAAVDDGWAALRWARANAAALGIDPSRIAVAGDSAGANLATVAALLERDAGSPALKCQLLVYPVTDLRAQTASYGEPSDRQLMTAETMRWFIGHYTADESQRLDWRASPLMRDNLSGLPPAVVITAGFDPLRDEGRAYADRLSSAGVSTTYVCFERQVHGFITMTRVTPEAFAAWRFAAAELRHALAA
jgi:acetyl esterase